MGKIEQIQDRCAQEYGITVEQLLSKSRKKRLVNARHLAIFIVKEWTGLSDEKIAHKFKRDDRTTVSHATKKVRFLKGLGKIYAREYRTIVDDLRGSGVLPMPGTGITCSP